MTALTHFTSPLRAKFVHNYHLLNDTCNTGELNKHETFIEIKHWKEKRKHSSTDFSGKKPQETVLESDKTHVCISHSVTSDTSITLYRSYDEPYMPKISHSQYYLEKAMLTLAKLYHFLVHSFMIQQEILIAIKCLSANQKQLLYIRVC